ncbi:DUF3095 domain-containing protein [Altericista sp. CCNU0014]|uniref:DUF3095 domain-containing protein n=1 Tax=Altericista sp. CCNU0014 TaxID=3082949 RepID=UPI00384B521C
MSTQDFYATLPELTCFLDLANPERYAEVPDDWYILITDVVGSTQKIAQGYYKEVNLLGASSIIAVLNAIRPVEIPFVFGGDGASLSIPPACLSLARDALIGVRQLARTSFAMELRVGIVPVATVNLKYPLKVAKCRLTSHYCQASFIGGGMTYATDLIKTKAIYRLEGVQQPVTADLTGMECRWQEVPSRFTHTLSLIVAATPRDKTVNDRIYQDILEAVEQIYGTIENYHPIDLAALKLTFNPVKLSAEVKARASSTRLCSRARYLLQVLLENGIGLIAIQFDLRLGGVDWGRYKRELRAASDCQKIDDALRMVLAGTPEQTEQLTQYLESRFQAGHLVYGIHISDRALLTCLILDRRNRHLHLVDGAGGGYAFAARELKLRQRARNNQIV